jgi:O-antigen/teichoic acid export membrane protein
MSTSYFEAAESATATAKRLPTLRSDFIWTFAGNSIYAACQWAVLVLLAKTGTPELVGHYAFAIAVATPIITFANLQLRSVQASDLREEFAFKDYLGFRLWTTAAALAVLTVLCICMRYSRDTIVLIETVGLALGVEAISDVYYGLMQNRLKMDRIAKSMMMRGILSLLALGLAMRWTHNLVFAVVLMALARLSIAVAYDFRGGIKGLLIAGGPQEKVPGRPRWTRQTQWKILKTAFPVGFVAVLISLNTYIPRYFIQWAAGAAELGIFSAISFFQSTGNMITGALGQAALVRLATAYNEPKPQRFVFLLSKLMLIGLVLGIVGVFVAAIFGKEILSLMYRPEYGRRADLLVFLMIAAGCGYLTQFVGVAITAARIFAPQVPVCIAVGIALTATSYLLVPAQGVSGAIWSILVAMSVQLAGYLIVLAMAMRKRSRVEAAACAGRGAVKLNGEENWEVRP